MLAGNTSSVTATANRKRSREGFIQLSSQAIDQRAEGALYCNKDSTEARTKRHGFRPTATPCPLLTFSGRLAVGLVEETEKHIQFDRQVRRWCELPQTHCGIAKHCEAEWQPLLDLQDAPQPLGILHQPQLPAPAPVAIALLGERVHRVARRYRL